MFLRGPGKRENTPSSRNFGSSSNQEWPTSFYNKFSHIQGSYSRFLESDFYQEKLDDPDFLSKFPSLLQIDRDEIRKCLQTDGKWADETLVQLTAIALDVEIKIEDLSRPGEILVTFESLGGHNKASQMLHLLFRVDKKHPVYTENFQLMQEGGKLITSDGHFWLVQNSPTSSRAAKRGNMQGSVLARPE